MQAIRTLPDTQRRVVELLKLQELSLKEASALTGMTAGALKASFHRALTALRKKLGAESPASHCGA
jgi:RNA polymerase sigma-70 factor, ECF subfamily